MNSKIFSAFAAVALALAATSPSTFAKVYTSATFNAALKAKVGTKTGPAAYNAAASLYKAALGDKKNKKLTVTFTKAVIKILKKPVPIPLQGKSRSTLANALVNGYFKGVAYDPQDSKFSTALRLLSSGLSGSQKTSATAKLIADPVLAFNTKKGGTAANINFINEIIYPALGQPLPPPAS